MERSKVCLTTSCSLPTALSQMATFPTSMKNRLTDFKKSTLASKPSYQTFNSIIKQEESKSIEKEKEETRVPLLKVNILCTPMTTRRMILR